MDFNADAMAEPMTETALIAGLVDDIAGNPIDILANHAGLNRINCGKLRPEHRVVYAFLFVADCSQRNGPGHI